jgi:hypothetical protein
MPMKKRGVSLARAVLRITGFVEEVVNTKETYK